MSKTLVPGRDTKTVQVRSDISLPLRTRLSSIAHAQPYGRSQLGFSRHVTPRLGVHERRQQIVHVHVRVPVEKVCDGRVLFAGRHYVDEAARDVVGGEGVVAGDVGQDHLGEVVDEAIRGRDAVSFHRESLNTRGERCSVNDVDVLACPAAGPMTVVHHMLTADEDIVDSERRRRRLSERGIIRDALRIEQH